MAGMESELYTYMNNLKNVTEDKQRTLTELEVGSRIQYSMLPDGKYEDDKYIITAFLRTAKEVGGDFYDYFNIDDDHVCIVTADVSGKGVPAALFMAVSKAVVKSTILENSTDLKDAFCKANRLLCEKNEEMMFVTVFAAIYSFSEKTLRYVNAGHEHPIFYYKDKDRYEIIKEEHDLCLGIAEDIDFRERQVALNNGDKLFMYTDGVTDATNTEDKLYGIERIIETLNENANKTGEAITNALLENIENFENGREQFDDITMLVFETK